MSDKIREALEAYVERDVRQHRNHGVLYGQAIAALAQPTDDELAERMKAAGMLTIEQMMAGAPLDAFTRHAGVVDMPSFMQWIEMRRKEAMSLQARLTLDKREDHELFEWAIAHAAVFGEVHVNLKAAIAQEGADHE